MIHGMERGVEDYRIWISMPTPAMIRKLFHYRPCPAIYGLWFGLSTGVDTSY